MKIVLASKSPRRQELLQRMGITDFAIIPASGEESVDESLPPEDIVALLARQKAEEISRQLGDDSLVIAADTLVFLDGKAMGKPRDKEDAARMLRLLSGRAHQVYSGVCVTNGKDITAQAECSTVFFRPLTEEEIHAYIATGEPMDKAGAYGIQGFGSMLVRRIEGDYFNIMGLPVCRLYTILKSFGTDLLKVKQ